MKERKWKKGLKDEATTKLQRKVEQKEASHDMAMKR